MKLEGALQKAIHERVQGDSSVGDNDAAQDEEES